MLCQNNWIDISWDGHSRREQTENLKVKFNTKASQLVPFDQACDHVAQSIASQHNNIFISLSGGCDSENVANVFVRNKIPFTPLIITYNKTKGDEQRYEQWFAYYWCKKNNIKPLVVDVSDYIESAAEHQQFMELKPRLLYGPLTVGSLANIAEQHGASLVTGYQLEYYPDHEQMTYLEPQLKDYNGFVMEESDFYLETMQPNRHPWAFYYWCPEILASFINSWNTDLTMQENKVNIYNVSPRPKMGYPGDIISYRARNIRELYRNKWGTLDCALMGTKEHLLLQLLE